MQKQRERTMRLFLVPALAMMCCIQLLPMLYNIGISFCNKVLTDPNRELQFIGFRNYEVILTDDNFWNAVGNTLTIAIVSVILQLVLGLCLALLLDSRGPFGQEPAGMGFFRGLLFIPYMIMPVMIGLMWYIFSDINYGMLNPILSTFGITGYAWFAEAGTVVPAIIAMDTWQCTPMIMLILAAGLKGVDRSMYEAAIVDGANAWQKFWSVTLPMLVPVLKVAVTMRLMDVMRIYDSIMATSKGGPGVKSEVISIYVYKLAFSKYNTSRAAAAAILITILILIISQLVVKFFSLAGDRDHY